MQTNEYKVATIILAGGEGSRLFPLTKTRCKPAVSFGGQFALIDIPLMLALREGFPDICIISQYLAQSLKTHINKYPKQLLQNSNIQLITPQPLPESLYQGTADAVRKNLPFLMSNPYDYFLILSGDQVYDMNLRGLIDFAHQSKSELVIASLAVGEERISRLGAIKIDEQNQDIVDFFEKPQDEAQKTRFRINNAPAHGISAPFLGSMGIYVFSRAGLSKLLDQPGNDFGHDLIPLQIRLGKTKAFIFNGYWDDIGTIKSYHAANLALTKPSSFLTNSSLLNPLLQGRALVAPTIHSSLITQSLIQSGSTINRAHIFESIIGEDVTVDEGASITNSIVLGGACGEAQVGKRCRIENSIIGQNVRIGQRVCLTNAGKILHCDHPPCYIRDGIIIVQDDATIPNNFVL